MSGIQIHPKKFGINKTSGLASTIFFSLAFLILFGLPDSVRAYEWDSKTLEETGNMNFPKPETSALFDSLQKKGYIFGIKMDFEVNTVFSTPKKKLKSDQLSTNFLGEDYFSSGDHFPNELPLASEMSLGAKPAKLIEIRF